MNRLLYLPLFLISLLFIPTIAFSQSQYAKAFWNKTRQKSEKSGLRTVTQGDIDVVGTTKDGIRIIKREEYIFEFKERTKHFIENYSDNFSKIKAREIQLDNEEEDYNNILLHNDKLLLFTSFENNKLEKAFLFVQELDKSTLLSVGEKKKLVEVDLSKNPLPSKSSLLARTVDRMGKANSATSKEDLAIKLGYVFRVTTNNDSSEVMITYQLPVARNEYKKVYVALLDKNLKLKHQKAYELPYKESEFEMEKLGTYYLDSMGTAYISGTHELSRKEKVKKIFSVSDDLELKEYSFPLMKEFVIYKYALDNTNEIRMYGGYVKDINRKKKEKGVVYLSANRESGKVEKNITIPLEEKYQRILNAEKYTHNFTILHNLIENKDGSVLITLEDISGSSKDITVLNLDENGVVKWSTLVSKRQYGSTYTSFYEQKVGDKLYLIFPEHIDNKSLELSVNDKVDDYAINSKEAMLSVVVIDLVTGKAIKEKIYRFFPKKDKEWIIPRKMAKITETEALIYAEGDDTFKIGKITFKP
ncbi:hypothetical protein ACE193_15505 [Bernardetia sp. OM2101]|uniref:hypothetical protein n=1 Tax=Bernardetia sp. OM2101 TaxID=3344876 RepID=UPI0035D0ECDF